MVTRLQRYFQQPIILSLWCMVAAFGTYFCMYAFRKPFTAADYAGASWLGIEFKIVLVTAQVMGYALSKFVGIRLISELANNRRALLLVVFMVIAEVGLVLFGFTARPWNLVWLFVNGLPLGMVFGLVLRYLEGRRHTELLTAALCISFITADGVVKSVGKYLLDQGVPEDWMPALAGGIFFPFFLVFVWMLSQIPLPNHADIVARSERTTMDSRSRRDFFHRYGIGLILLITSYTLVTILRSMRADFAPEIWKTLGATVKPEIFTYSELVVAFGVMVLCGSVVFIKNNRLAFFVSLGISLFGILLLLLGNTLWVTGVVSPFGFMVLNGLGLYLPYIAVHTTIFERLIAMTRDRGNLGYLMYLADAVGYLGYVAVMLAKNFGSSANEFAGFYLAINWGCAVISILLIGGCWRYFATHERTQAKPVQATSELVGSGSAN